MDTMIVLGQLLDTPAWIAAAVGAFAFAIVLKAAHGFEREDDDDSAD